MTTIAECQQAEAAVRAFGGRAYRSSFTWHPEPASSVTYTSGYHSTAEAADKALARIVSLSQFKPRRWWQWWRWGEQRPPQVR